MQQKLGIGESIALYALLTAVTALSLDILLPAYPAMGMAFESNSAIDLQSSILFFVVGMLLGELLAGVLADRYGRRPALAASMLIFGAGTLICLFATSYPFLLLGRALQGVGAAGQKIVTRAMIRDRFSGAAMARIMSYVLATFVALPFIAPALGAALTKWYGWRSIFIFLGCYGLATFIWYWQRHPETRPASLSTTPSQFLFFDAVQNFFRHHQCVWLTLTAGFLFGVHLSFISLSPLLFADVYDVAENFPFYFGGIVCAFGLALVLNARFVERVGMVSMVTCGVIFLQVAQILFLIVILVQGSPSLAIFLLYGFCLLFALGLIFGNLTAMVLQPLGHIAGVASALMSAFSTAVALLVSAVAGLFYKGALWEFAVLCEVAAILAILCFAFARLRL